jgi:twitching motility protein PilT
MIELPEAIAISCRAALEYRASDLILRSDECPILRISGSVTSLDAATISRREILSLRQYCHVPETALDYDTSLMTPDGTRFRVNFHRHLGSEAAVLRRINSKVPSLEELGVPDLILKSWSQRRSGIVVVSGITGSGKSTTLASTLEWINQNLERHIVTIEDPVEFVFKNEKSFFTQREVGIDTPSFAEGLRRSLRQAPDIILLGEIRDAETAEIALQAAETGHLVFTTLHSASASEAIERLSGFFPENLRSGYLQVLSNQLLGILCQRLMPSLQGGSVLASEYFSNVGIMRGFVREADMDGLADQIAVASPDEAMGFLRSLVALVHANAISEEEAMTASPRPVELRRMLMGISDLSN